MPAEQARDQAQVARDDLTAAAAALGGDPRGRHRRPSPRPKAALAAVESARYNLSVTTVTAPADGLIYQATAFREGQ
jgi:membrane fusion protein (multidrug efflux system)